jgi:ubiquinol-cytochrome c reductase cytochrome b subunit
MYDKFVTGVAWPGLFIFALLIIPFIDRYKKFSWKDRPIITAIGITSIAQIIITTYWGFYIDPDIKKSLLERLVIDPIFFYLVMLLLVPLSFGFTYMMIKLARNAEANAKLQPKRAGSKSSISLPQKWIYILFVGLMAFQIYLNISAYYAVLNGMKNFSLFIVGVIMLVFAGMFHIYRHGRAMAKAPPPKPVTPPSAERPRVPPPTPKPPSAIPAATTTAERTPPLTTPPVQKSAAGGSQQPPTPPPTKQASSSSSQSSKQSSINATIPSNEKGPDSHQNPTTTIPRTERSNVNTNRQDLEKM